MLSSPAVPQPRLPRHDLSPDAAAQSGKQTGSCPRRLLLPAASTSLAVPAGPLFLYLQNGDNSTPGFLTRSQETPLLWVHDHTSVGRSGVF